MSINFLAAIPWKKLVKVGKPFWLSESRRTGFIYLGTILGLMVANSLLNVFLGWATGQFMTSLSKRSMLEFWRFLGVWILAIFVAMPVQAFYGYFRSRLALIWRRWLSRHLLADYFNKFAYYRLLSEKQLDNPEQRMTQDVDSFCNTSVGLFITIMDAVVTIGAFMVVLWNLMPALPIRVFGVTAANSVLVLWACKLILPVAVLTYSALGSAIVVWIGREMPDLSFRELKTEADLRFSLGEVRTDANTIALTGAASLAEAYTTAGLNRVVAVVFRIYLVERNVAFFTTPFNMLMTLIPTSIMGYLYVKELVPFGSIAQATIAFSAIFGGATILIGQFSGIMAYGATIERVGAVVEAIERADVANDQERIEVDDGSTVKYDNVTVMSPDDTRTLIKALSLEVTAGVSLLITGEHGVGKTALLRATAGFYLRGHGHVQRPLGRIMFLTPSPYLPPTTLRQALCYCFDALCDDDARLLRALALAKLPELHNRSGGFDTLQTWHELLTLSELQRLSLARVILAKPKYVAIDDGTNALQNPEQQLFYKQLHANGCTIISAGPPSLAVYHQRSLELHGDGSWTLHDINESIGEIPSTSEGQNHSRPLELVQRF